MIHGVSRFHVFHQAHGMAEKIRKRCVTVNSNVKMYFFYRINVSFFIKHNDIYDENDGKN